MFKVSCVLEDQLCSRCRRWLTAPSKIRWSKVKQSFFNDTDPAAVHSLLQNAPDRSRRLTEAIDQFFLANSAIIFFAPYTFSTVRPLLIIHSFSDNILLLCL